MRRIVHVTIAALTAITMFSPLGAARAVEERPGPLRIHVVDEQGVAVDHAWVCVWQHEDEQCAETGPDGSIEQGSLTTAVVHVSVEDLRERFAAVWYPAAGGRPASQPVTVPSQGLDLTVLVEPSVRLSGRILDPEGESVALARVCSESMPQMHVDLCRWTDWLGRYELRVAADRPQRVYAHLPPNRRPDRQDDGPDEWNRRFFYDDPATTLVGDPLVVGVEGRTGADIQLMEPRYRSTVPVSGHILAAESALYSGEISVCAWIAEDFAWSRGVLQDPGPSGPIACGTPHADDGSHSARGEYQMPTLAHSVAISLTVGGSTRWFGCGSTFANARKYQLVPGQPLRLPTQEVILPAYQEATIVSGWPRTAVVPSGTGYAKVTVTPAQGRMAVMQREACSHGVCLWRNMNAYQFGYGPTASQRIPLWASRTQPVRRFRLVFPETVDGRAHTTRPVTVRLNGRNHGAHRRSS